MPNFHHLRHVIPVCHFSLVLPSVWVPFLCHTLCLAAFLNYLASVLPISHLSFLFYALPSILSPLLRIVPSAKPYLKFGPFLVLSLSYALPSVWPLPLVLPLSYALPSVWPLPLVLPLSYVLPSVWPPSMYFPFSMLYLQFGPFPYVLSIFNALNLVWPLPLVLPLSYSLPSVWPLPLCVASVLPHSPPSCFPPSLRSEPADSPPWTWWGICYRTLAMLLSFSLRY